VVDWDNCDALPLIHRPAYRARYSCPTSIITHARIYTAKRERERPTKELVSFAHSLHLDHQTRATLQQQRLMMMEDDQVEMMTILVIY
jgi:hypothetical protein